LFLIFCSLHHQQVSFGTCWNIDFKLPNQNSTFLFFLFPSLIDDRLIRSKCYKNSLELERSLIVTSLLPSWS